MRSSASQRVCVRYMRGDGWRTMGKGVDLDVLAGLWVDALQASERVLSVDVHGAGATDPLTA